MNWLKDIFQRCWRGVVTVVGTIAIIVALVTAYNTFVTQGQLAAAVKQQDKKVELWINLQRLNNVTDSLMKAKIQSRQYPKDKDIAADVEELKAEKEKLQKKIEKK